MKKWEYLGAYYSKSVDMSVLNELGLQGWELIACIETGREIRWLFKREKK